MKSVLLVMLGGAIGAAMRYGIGRALPISANGWPWPTFACNLVGGFAMGLLVGWLSRFGAGAAGQDLRLLLGVGVLGGFTTFSAFSLELVLMFEKGQGAQATIYALLSVLLAFAALLGGLWIVRVVPA